MILPPLAFPGRTIDNFERGLQYFLGISLAKNDHFEKRSILVAKKKVLRDDHRANKSFWTERILLQVGQHFLKLFNAVIHILDRISLRVSLFRNEKSISQ